MLDYISRQTLLETLLTAYGEETQLQKTVESLTSLSLALQKHLRTPCDHEIEILENLTDLQLLLDQLRLLFCRDTPMLLTQMEEKKLKREQALLQTAPRNPGPPPNTG